MHALRGGLRLTKGTWPPGVHVHLIKSLIAIFFPSHIHIYFVLLSKALAGPSVFG